ncbi:MAG TPA: hypothetical protein VGE94_08450 [Chloroflexota bacterium]
MTKEIGLLIGHEDGLIRSRSGDAGQTWSAPELTLPNVEACAIHAGPDGVVYVGTRGDGLFRGDADGQRWQRLETPPALNKVRSIWRSGERMLVGTEPAGVYECLDGAWQAVGDVRSAPGASEWFYPVPTEGDHIRHLAVDPRDPRRIYAAVQVGGVCISPDGGATWEDRRNLDLDVHMVEPHPTEPGVLYAGTGGGGIYRSRDSGDTWQDISDGCGNFVVQFALDPADPSRLYLGTGRGHPPEWARTNTALGEVFRSDDGGDTWRKLRGGLPETMESRINTLLVDPANPDSVFFGAGFSFRGFVATDGGIYHSLDAGESWRKILDLTEPVALGIT